MNIREARVLGTTCLAEVSETPALDSRVLLKSVMEFSDSQVLVSDATLSPEQEKTFLEYLELRRKGYSVAVIIGQKDFYGRTFRVTKDTLVPRPDTEALVEAVLSRIDHSIKALDICTGTGCIGITIKAELSEKGIGCDMYLSDISPKALEIARQNCRQIIKNEAKCILSNLFGAFGGERFNLITANPPYIADVYRSKLSPEVLMEPEGALFSPDNGMALIRKIVLQASDYLSADGLLVLECDSSQAVETRGLMEESGYQRTFIIEDLNGCLRCVGGYVDA